VPKVPSVKRRDDPRCRGSPGVVFVVHHIAGSGDVVTHGGDDGSTCHIGNRALGFDG
jgi:hypothetical protein